MKFIKPGKSLIIHWDNGNTTTIKDINDKMESELKDWLPNKNKFIPTIISDEVIMYPDMSKVRLLEIRP